MTIFSRRDEIAMMKSIGADNYFIRGPFLVEAELYGLIAALIAMALGYLILTKLFPSLANYIEVDETEMFVRTWWPVILLAMMAIGWILGYVSARLALHKYLKKGN
jgi:cell division transport system permease protein